MWLYRLAGRHLYWSAAVLRKFFRFVPIPTLAVVALTLMSQFARLLAFFLPLKVIILIGSTGIPRYFPDSWAVYDQNVLVVALSLATLVFFLVHLLAEKLQEAMACQGAAGVVERSRKLVLFSNQDEVASQAYQKLAAGLATGVLTVMLGVLFAILYPAFLAVIVAYVTGISAVISLFTQGQPERRNKLQESAKSLIGLLSGGGFLVLFAFMVTDFLLWDGVSFMAAIISLLLSRQLFNRLDGLIKDALWLHGKRLEINAIFFTGHQLEKGPDSSRHRKLWGLLTLIERPEHLAPLLERAIGSPLAVDSTMICRWRQSGLIDILVFEVEVRLSDRESQHILLKVFNSRHKKAALNEADLLVSVTGRALPAPELLAVGQLEGFDVHLFRSPTEVEANHDDALNQLAQRTVRCWQVEPGENLVNRYRRSHPFLHQRLSSGMLQRLDAVFTDSGQRTQIDRLSHSLGVLQAELGRLPLAVMNPKVPRELTFVTTPGEVQLAHWGNWTLEPLGACLPAGLRREERLKQMLAAAAEQRDVLKTVPLERLRLCACCSAFETAFTKQKYADAIELIPEMLSCLPRPETVTGVDETETLQRSVKNS